MGDFEGVLVVLAVMAVIAAAVWSAMYYERIAREKREANEERERLKQKNAELEERIRKLEDR